MMRWKLRNVPCLCTLGGFVLFMVGWTYLMPIGPPKDPPYVVKERNYMGNNNAGDGVDQTKSKSDNSVNQLLIGDLPCLINGERTVTCLRDNNDEIYLPFKTFLQKYYEVTGFVTRKSDGDEVFEWWHSAAKIQKPQPNEKYDPRRVFGSFVTYNVENRDRVKCVSGINGVPLSTQWGPTPYHYPIQIAQYALEHYSKNLTEQAPFVVVHENGESRRGDDKKKDIWRVAPESAKSTVLERVFDVERNSSVLHFKTTSSMENPGIFIHLENNSSKLHLIRFWAKFVDSGNKSSTVGDETSFTITVERTDTKSFFYMHYIQTDEVLRTAEPNQIFYGLGRVGTNKNKWRRFTRNLLIDFTKSLMILQGAKKQKRLRLQAESVRLVSFAIRGEGYLDDFTQQSAAHSDHFFDAAEWLLTSQNLNNGGFEITVKRTFNDIHVTLEPPWYSAMAQGHAMSTLCRAYYATGEGKYKRAALAAAALFNVSATEGGVMSRFLDAHPWYEEYPTPEGTYVLNGFIYALIGLYDAGVLCAPGEDGTYVRKLYADGLASLKALLPLYDTGSGSLYDLRHVSYKSPPMVARWDYHAVHVYQLYTIFSISNETLFKATADRWVSYAKGARVMQH